MISRQIISRRCVTPTTRPGLNQQDIGELANINIKRWIGVVGGVLLVGGVLAVALRESFMQVVSDRMTNDMFVHEDTDLFNPGIAVGSRLPPVRVLHDGREVESLMEFRGAKGLLLFFNRSIDW